MEHRYPHKIECAIRALAHSHIAAAKLSTFLLAQQGPEFRRQDHLFGEAKLEFKKALKWVRAATKPLSRSRGSP